MKKILVINGPNLNLLGLREPALYGAQNFATLQQFIHDSAAQLSLDVELFQSNHEGAIVDKIQAAYGVFDGILINPAATLTQVWQYSMRSRLWRYLLPRCTLPISLHARSSAVSHTFHSMRRRQSVARASMVIKRAWNILKIFCKQGCLSF